MSSDPVILRLHVDHLLSTHIRLSDVKNKKETKLLQKPVSQYTISTTIYS